MRRNTKKILSQAILKDVVWENDLIALRATYEIWPNAYAVVNLEYNNARGHDITSEPIEGEVRLDAQGYLDRYTPKFYQGENFTLTCGFSIGF